MFLEKLNTIISTKKTLLCVGLDPDIEQIPPFLLSKLDPLLYFNQKIVEATGPYAAAYKLNLAFYEALGIAGWDLLEKTLALLPEDAVVIADAKRADVPNTSRKYAEAYFKTYGFDAVTVSPYMGLDALEPFLEHEDRGIFVLCLTSNPGSADFQQLPVNEDPLYLKVAERVMEWNFIYGNCGLVVGGTHFNEIERIRSVAPSLPFLIPGVGAQGGNLEWAVRYGTDERGLGALINASRSILYASQDRDFDRAAAEKARALRDQINQVLQAAGK
ncbi:MAG: orotidine-5'-phosphate decarboxylase [Calditrichaeota bacterium]|nr:MAG: orotidine-5'-phosphate decarboxylase [Calditrichota bacterium]